MPGRGGVGGQFGQASSGSQHPGLRDESGFGDKGLLCLVRKANNPFTTSYKQASHLMLDAFYIIFIELATHYYVIIMRYIIVSSKFNKYNIRNATCHAMPSHNNSFRALPWRAGSQWLRHVPQRAVQSHATEGPCRKRAILRRAVPWPAPCHSLPCHAMAHRHGTSTMLIIHR